MKFVAGLLYLLTLRPESHFDAAAVGDSDLDGDDAVAVFAMRVRDPDRGVAVLVVDDGLFGDAEDVLVLFEDDLGVGGHVGLELAAGVVDGDLDFEGGDVVLLDAERCDLGDVAVRRFGLGKLWTLMRAAWPR